MSDLNDLNGNSTPEELVNTESAEDAQTVRDEMEELAKVFQEELNRAKEEAEQVAQTVPADPEITLSAVDEIPAPSAAPTASRKNEPCDCCGENPRGTAENPDSIYCEECDAGLRHYPFDFLNIFFALVALCLVFYSGYVFADHTATFVAVQKADSLAAEKKMYSAIDAYATAANTMVTDRINGELVYKREILLAYDLGLVSELSASAENIRAWELSLPHFRAVKDALDRSADILAAAQASSTILYPYTGVAAKDFPYDDVIAQLEALKTTPVESATEEAETTSSSKKAYKAEAKQYDLAMLTFYKYYAALIAEKDLDTQIGLLEEIRDIAPDMEWLYAPLLLELYAPNGRDIEPLCKQLEAFNAEDNTSAMARMVQKRINKQYDEAIALGEEALRRSDDWINEINRQKALVLLAQGKYADAYTSANTAFQTTNQPSVEVIYTLALCAAAAGNEDTYKEATELLTSNGYTLPEELVGYKNGTVTLDQILFEGDYDIS